MEIDSIRKRKERYYQVFEIEIPKKSIGGGICIENIIANKEEIIRKSILNPGKIRSTIRCDDRFNKSKLLQIMINNMNIAKRM